MTAVKIGPSWPNFASMLVLLSPSKTLKPTPCPLGERALTVPTGLQDAMVTMDVLRLWSPSRIQEAMKVSPTLAAKVALWHEQWTPASNHAAGWTFQGDAFKSLDMGSFDGSGVNAAQKRLRILHGLYGMLKPLDAFAPVRLEMGQNWSPDTAHRTMASFWKTKLPVMLASEVDQGKHAFVLNLASAEYGDVALHGFDQCPVVECKFLENKGGTLKSISSFAKTARGAMARHVLLQGIVNPEDLKSFDGLGYRFSSEQSEGLKLVFTRTSQA